MAEIVGLGTLQRDGTAGFERRIDEKPGTAEIVGGHGKSGREPDLAQNRQRAAASVVLPLKPGPEKRVKRRSCRVIAEFD